MQPVSQRSCTGPRALGAAIRDHAAIGDDLGALEVVEERRPGLRGLRRSPARPCRCCARALLSRVHVVVGDRHPALRKRGSKFSTAPLKSGLVSGCRTPGSFPRRETFSSAFRGAGDGQLDHVISGNGDGGPTREPAFIAGGQRLHVDFLRRARHALGRFDHRLGLFISCSTAPCWPEQLGLNTDERIGRHHLGDIEVAAPALAVEIARAGETAQLGQEAFVIRFAELADQISPEPIHTDLPLPTSIVTM